MIYDLKVYGVEFKNKAILILTLLVTYIRYKYKSFTKQY